MTTTGLRRTSRKIKSSRSDKIFYTVVTVIITLFTLSVILPLLNILASSFSNPTAVVQGRVFFWPVGFTLDGYRAVFRTNDVWIGYRNTLMYTSVGTVFNVSVTMFCGFALSRQELPFRGFMMFLFTFTMFFGGGLIPTFINIVNLGLFNSFWVMIIPGLMSVFSMIIARTFIQSTIPGELYEAAHIDGCDYAYFFFRIVLPLSKAVIAVLVLNYAVGHWNSFFNALIFLRDRELFPLQLFLREILVMNTIDDAMLIDFELMEIRRGIADLLRYSLIVVATLPILCVYPFLQKYFMKGVMIGSLKG